MRRVSIAAVSLALGMAATLGSRTASAELVPGGWLMPPRIPQVVPIPAPPPRVAPPVVHRKPPRQQAPPAARRPPPPSDGKVRF